MKEREGSRPPKYFGVEPPLICAISSSRVLHLRRGDAVNLCRSETALISGDESYYAPLRLDANSSRAARHSWIADFVPSPVMPAVSRFEYAFNWRRFCPEQTRYDAICCFNVRSKADICRLRALCRRHRRHRRKKNSASRRRRKEIRLSRLGQIFFQGLAAEKSSASRKPHSLKQVYSDLECI